MKISNKILLTAILAVSLASCTNYDSGENISEDVVASMEDDSTDKPKDELIEDVSEDANTEVSENEDKAETDKKVEESKAEEKTVINVKNQNKEENKEDSNKENADDSQNMSESEEDMDYQDQDGVYFSSLVASKGGERDSDMGLATISSIKIEEDTLIVEGTMDYREDPNSEASPKELEKKTYKFKFNSDTKFQAVGGLAEPEIFTPAEFIEYYQGITDSGLGLNIEVKNGIASTVSFAS